MPEPSDLTDLLVEGARYGDLEDVQSALGQGVSVNERDEQGRTGMNLLLWLTLASVR